MRAVELFAGIGGFGLGLHDHGIEVTHQVEVDPFRRAVLARHFPDARQLADVRSVGPRQLGQVDVMAGGFPCQDTSNTGYRQGLDGADSGLWREFLRLVRGVGPRLVFVENVTGLRHRGLGQVLGDLASLGFDACWDCVPARAVGAPHYRDRLWLVAYPHEEGRDRRAWASGARWWREPEDRAGWPPEPRVGRVADGLPAGLDRGRLAAPGRRVAALGDSLVPTLAQRLIRAGLRVA